MSSLTPSFIPSIQAPFITQWFKKCLINFLNEKPPFPPRVCQSCSRASFFDIVVRDGERVLPSWLPELSHRFQSIIDLASFISSCGLESFRNGKARNAILGESKGTQWFVGIIIIGSLSITSGSVVTFGFICKYLCIPWP